MARTSAGSLTLEQFAEAKKLPADFLEREGIEQNGSGIRFPYFDDAGDVIAYKSRTALKAKDGSYWPKGQTLAAYGLWRLDLARRAGMLFLVEGESDALTLWLHDLPALGIPGANAAKCLTAEGVAGVSKIYVSREPDAGGPVFVKGILGRLRSINWQGEAFELTMPDGVKDPNELHQQSQEGGFLARFQERVQAAPLIWPEPSNGQATAATPRNGPDDREPHLTDMGNAQRFTRDHGEDVRHCFPWKKWACWDGKRWRIDDTGETARARKKTVRRMYEEAAAKLVALKRATDLDDEQREAIAGAIKKIIAHAQKSEDARAISRMLDLARSEPGIPILPGDLDSNPWLLNCRNGTLDLRTGKLHSHRREDAITKLCPVAYNPDAACPRFVSAVDAKFDQDSDLAESVQCYLGYGLTGDVREQALPIWWGSGSNGKSTLINAVLDTIGSDYAGMVPPELLMEQRAEQHPTIVADLFGKRLLIAAETGQGRRLNESRLKVLTGGDKIKARRMREDFWEFAPTHKLVLITNHKPEVKGTDHAIWRRLRLVPFGVQFLDPDAPENHGRAIPKHLRIDRKLPEALKAEREGLLAWLVRGCLHWQKRGSLSTPAKISAATAGYRDGEDVVGAFVSECCVTGGADYRVRSGDLYARYVGWAKAAGEDAMTKKRFGDALTERGIERFQSHGWWYRGLSLVQDDGKDQGE